MECLTHGLLTPYPVLHEKGGELVAQVRCEKLLSWLIVGSRLV